MDFANLLLCEVLFNNSFFLIFSGKCIWMDTQLSYSFHLAIVIDEFLFKINFFTI